MCLSMPGGRTEKQDPVEAFSILNKNFAMPESIIGCQFFPGMIEELGEVVLEPNSYVDWRI